MTNAPDPEHQLELDARDVIERCPAVAESYQQAALWLIAVRTGQILPRYRKLLLVDGRPVDDSPDAA